MKMSFWIIFVILFTSGVSVASAGAGFGTFQSESDRTTKIIKCENPKISPRMEGWGALYGCVQGAAETAKWFINEDDKKAGVVKNVKIIWNDWYKDLGDGVNADKKEAFIMVNALSELYAPSIKVELIAAFEGRQSKVWKSNGFRIAYTWSRGSAIDERMFVVTQE